MNCPIHVTVAAVVERAGRFLLVEERVEGRTVFNQPAGHLEPGESLLQAIQREMREETALPFEPRALVGIYQYELPEKRRTYVRFCFTGKVGQALPGAELDAEIIATHWLTLQEIQALGERLRSPMVLRCIQDHQTGRHLPLDCLQRIHP